MKEREKGPRREEPPGEEWWRGQELNGGENKQNEEIKGEEIEADNSVSSIQISEGVEGKASTNDSDCEREEETERTKVIKNMKKGCRKGR